MTDPEATPGGTGERDGPDGRVERDRAHGLSYPCGEPPAAGIAKEVAPGVLWLRMPLPFSLNHINLWAVRDDAADGAPGWSIFDTGTQTKVTAEAWRALLGEGGALHGAAIRRIFVTHMHPDHVGMAGWLRRRTGAMLWMTRGEYTTCRTLVSDTGREAPADGVDFYRRAAWSEAALDDYRAKFGGFGKLVYALPDSYRRVREGDVIRIGAHDWRVVVGTGHSPEHACFVSDSLKLLISGDQVLPRISSNVSVFPTEPEADPLGDWIDSLERLRRDLSDDLLVLPAHGEPFRGLHARLDRLHGGHMLGLQRLRRSLATGRKVPELFGALFARPIGDDLLSLATGETLAHLNYLLARGEASRHTAEDGVDRYRLAGA